MSVLATPLSSEMLASSETAPIIATTRALVTSILAFVLVSMDLLDLLAVSNYVPITAPIKVCAIFRLGFVPAKKDSQALIAA